MTSALSSAQCAWNAPRAGSMTTPAFSGFGLCQHKAPSPANPATDKRLARNPAYSNRSGSACARSGRLDLQCHLSLIQHSRHSFTRATFPILELFRKSTKSVDKCVDKFPTSWFFHLNLMPSLICLFFMQYLTCWISLINFFQLMPFLKKQTI